MTPARIAELRKLCEEATPGPWRHKAPAHITHDGTATMLAGTIAICTDPVHPSAKRDAAFIAAARTALPELIAEVERLREELNVSFKAQIDQMRFGERRVQESQRLLDEWQGVAATLPRLRLAERVAEAVDRAIEVDGIEFGHGDAGQAAWEAYEAWRMAR